MEPSSRYFSPDYATAQSRFHRMAKNAGGKLQTLPLDAKGPFGEALGIDIAWFGAANPRRALVHSTGLHGVEGFAGSAIQLQLLESLPAFSESVALVLVHILNPYGMTFLRRVNENNVDMNRNFLEAGQFPLRAPEVYRRLSPFLNPKTPPSPELFLLRMAGLILRHGMPALTQAVHSGQHEFPKGLFFGGNQLEQGPQRYLHYLTDTLASVERAVFVDVHTGMGPYADDTLLCPVEESERLRQRFGERVVRLDPKDGIGARVTGTMGSMIARTLPKPEVFAMIQEFGTYGPVRMFRALRAENRWHHYGGGALDHPAKLALKAVFCPTDQSWRERVLQRGQALNQQALDVLQR